MKWSHFIIGLLAIINIQAYAGIIYQCDFKPGHVKGWLIPSFAATVKDGNRYAMKISTTKTKLNQQHLASYKLDLKPYRGKKLLFICQSKAKNVSKPNARYNGVKFMFHYTTTAGKNSWNHPVNLYGTYKWQKISFSATIPHNVDSGTIYVGLQDSTGTAWFSDLKVLKYDNEELYAKISLPPNFKAEYTSRVKDMPPLRGVMSPRLYRSGDIEDLSKWKANLVRWQIARNWGKTGMDRDLGEYSKWIDSKIAELDKVLVAAKKNGIKVIIDLHSPPGGRYADRNMAMNYEKKYADQFIEIWQRMAKHFKGNSAIWAYDLINEPFQTRPAKIDYLTLQIKAAKAVRAIDPDVPIIIESNIWSTPETYKYLSPVPMKNIIYQVHMYIPTTFTHQNVYTNWGVKSIKQQTVVYPGFIEDENFNRETLRKYLQPVIDFQNKYGVRIYAGEFSVARWAPGAAKYLDDCISIFEENHWDWTYHAYREFHGWSVEHSKNPHDRKRTKQDTDRKKVLLKYFKLGKNPYKTTVNRKNAR